MDSEPVSVSRSDAQLIESSINSHLDEVNGNDDEEPYSFSGPSNALFGITIAIATIGIPSVAVLTERPIGLESILPTALETDGSKAPLPISVTRVSKPLSRDSRRKQE